MSFSWQYVSVPWLYPALFLLPQRECFIVKHSKDPFTIENINSPTKILKMPLTRYSVATNYSLPPVLPSAVMREFANMAYRISPSSIVWFLLETIYFFRKRESDTDSIDLNVSNTCTHEHYLGSMLSSKSFFYTEKTNNIIIIIKKIIKGPFGSVQMYYKDSKHDVGNSHVFLTPSSNAKFEVTGQHELQFIYYFSVWSERPPVSLFTNKPAQLDRVVCVPNAPKYAPNAPFVKFVYEPTMETCLVDKTVANFSNLSGALAIFMKQSARDVAIPLFNFYYHESKSLSYIIIFEK